MLTEAIELNKKISSDERIVWSSTDYELLMELHKNKQKLDIQRDNPNALPVQDIIERLVTGNLYGCVCILSSKNLDAYKKFTDFTCKSKMEDEINQKISPELSIVIENFSKDEQKAIQGIKGIYYNDDTKNVKVTVDLNVKSKDNLVSDALREHWYEIENAFISMRERYKKFKIKNPRIALHPILDNNKTERQLKIQLDDQTEVSVGKKSQELLIGVFLRNSDWNMYKIDKMNKNSPIIQEICNYFAQQLNDPSIKIIEKYGEKKYV